MQGKYGWHNDIACRRKAILVLASGINHVFVVVSEERLIQSSIEGSPWCTLDIDKTQ